jgi:uncharacterized MAPEG superfamily protein
MTPSAVALLGFSGWTILLVGMLGLFRTGLVFGGKKRANEFRASGEDLQGFGQRLTRAHANCYENLPVAGAVLLYAISTGQTAITDDLAMAFLGARLLQSLTHIISTASPAVLLRFAFFGAQMAILTIWILRLAHLI